MRWGEGNSGRLSYQGTCVTCVQQYVSAAKSERNGGGLLYAGEEEGAGSRDPGSRSFKLHTADSCAT